jgi:branched-chain amino acid transport system substrate-binding protein
MMIRRFCYSLPVLALIGITVATPVRAACELKLGAMGPLSGPAAQWGLAMTGAATLAAAEANKDGGLKVGGEVCHVTVVTYDSKYTAEGAAAGANQLISDGVKFIVGPVGSPEVTGIKPVAARNHVLVLADSYAKNAIGKQWPLVFHVGPGPSEWADPIVKAAKAKFNIHSVVVVAPNDQGGTDIASVDADVYKANGITASEEYYQRGTSNFEPIISRILSSKPDAVDTASSPPGDTGIIAKQLRQAGFQGPIGHLGGPGTAEIARVAGGLDVLKNFYWYETTPTEDPKVRAITSEYKELLGKDAPENTNMWLWVAAPRMLLQAIAKAGTTTDTKKVAEVLRNMPVKDPNLGEGRWTGEKFFGINQELSFPFGMGMIVDGKMQGVQRMEVAAQ